MNQYPSAMIGFEQCTIVSGYTDTGYCQTSTLSAPVGMTKGFLNSDASQYDASGVEALSRENRADAQRAVGNVFGQRERSVDDFGQTISVPFPVAAISETASVTVRVRDIAHGLKSMSDAQLAWIEDLGDDPIVLTSDFYEVFLACQKIIEERRRAG